jgi:hypothetical protein
MFGIYSIYNKKKEKIYCATGETYNTYCGWKYGPSNPVAQ